MDIKLIKARISYPFVFTPQANTLEGGKPCYSAQLILPKNGDMHKQLIAALPKVAEEKWPGKAQIMLRALQADGKLGINDGLKRADAAGYGEGIIYISARSYPPKKPLVYDLDGTLLDETNGPTKILPGYYVNAKVSMYAYDNPKHPEHGKRICFSLLALRLAAIGDVLAGSAPVEADELADDLSVTGNVTDDLLGL